MMPDLMQISHAWIASWQPIETAPTQRGARVLLFARRILVGTRWEDGYWEREGGGLIDTPTHWMPLPAPPEAP